MRVPIILWIGLLFLFSSGNCLADSVLLSKTAAASDIDEVISIVEEVHPDPYTMISRSRIAEMIAEVKRRLPEKLGCRELFIRLAPVIASLKDGHTSLRLPSADFRQQAGDSAFPIDVKIGSSGVVVVRDFSESRIPIDSRILEINGENVEAIVERLMRFQHAELEPARRANIAKYFPEYLWCVLQIQSPFSVVYSNGEGHKSRVVTQGMSVATISRLRATAGPAVKPYSYRRLTESNVGVIEYNLCQPSAAFDRFLRETFEAISRDRIAALVIDLRRNGGGSARANVALFDYVTDRRYRMYSGGALKISERMKRKLGRSQFEDRYTDWDTPSGTLLTVSEREEFWYQPGKNRLRFGGPVYVLAGVGTQSSGMNFVSAVKDCRLGLVVGKETGDPATAFGDLEPFRLAESGLELYVSTKYFIRPNGDTKRRGIIPDIHVPASGPSGNLHADAAIQAVVKHMSDDS